MQRGRMVFFTRLLKAVSRGHAAVWHSVHPWFCQVVSCLVGKCCFVWPGLASGSWLIGVEVGWIPGSQSLTLKVQSGCSLVEVVCERLRMRFFFWKVQPALPVEGGAEGVDEAMGSTFGWTGNVIKCLHGGFSCSPRGLWWYSTTTGSSNIILDSALVSHFHAQCHGVSRWMECSGQ